MSDPINRLQKWFKARGRERSQRAWLAWFDRIWQSLAECHLVDDLGGAQYRRICQEWETANYPVPLIRFIRQRANLPSSGDDAPPPAGSGVQP